MVEGHVQCRPVRGFLASRRVHPRASLQQTPFVAGMAHVSAGDLPGILAAGLVFSLTNLVVTELAVALAQGRGLLTNLVDDFVFQMSTAAIFLAMAPIAVVLADP